ncbi:MAG TPA: PilZ domain-containing protein [Pyrinomonadaceae bacterium]|nr:PilZ domain-containing protein [Pyrinomonadaceae bacterium]
MSSTIELQTEPLEVTHAVALNAVVKGRTSDSRQWKEIADVSGLTATGATFFLSKECPVGTLIALILPVPKELRAYDKEKELYRVWGVVQHCQKTLSANDCETFHIGVAFIGKHQPDSYNENPDQCYKICGMTDDGLWRVTEAKSAYKQRRHTRFHANIEHYLAIVDNNLFPIKGEKTVSENISKSGAAVFTEMEIKTGDRVKFICEKYDFSGLAVVCNVRCGEDGRQRVHLNFVDTYFPVEKIRNFTNRVSDK